MLTFLLTFLIAFVLTILLTPMVRSFAPEIGAVDKPSSRKVHQTLIPRTGGIAIYFSFLVAVLFGLLVGQVSGTLINPRPILGILFGGSIVMIVGLLDDIYRLKPLFKLLVQLLGAGIAIYFGVEISFVSNPFNGLMPLGFIAIPLTLLWPVTTTSGSSMSGYCSTALMTGAILIASGLVPNTNITLFLFIIFATPLSVLFR